MEAVQKVICVNFPKYLQKLPIPKSLSGFSELSGEKWMQLIPFVATMGLLVYVTLRTIFPSRPPPPKVNLSIKKDSPKVADLVDIEDMAKDKVSYCRCWRSSKFPYCDGSHNKHNETTGDNVGPLVLKRKAKA